jgi:SAM-dependent methyltransferase
MTGNAQTRWSYDVVAERYASEVSGELADKPLDRGLLQAFAELASGGVVLDVGCGPGHIAGYLTSWGAGVVGIDLSPVMCAIGARATSLPFCAGDMTALPIRSASVSGIACLYAVIHLDAEGRAGAYAEFARVLAPGALALIAFHTSDADVTTGGAAELREWWGEAVDLTFRFLDPDAEATALNRAGLDIVARLDREPDAAVEHPSKRTYLLARRL